MIVTINDIIVIVVVVHHVEPVGVLVRCRREQVAKAHKGSRCWRCRSTCFCATRRKVTSRRQKATIGSRATIVGRC